MSAADLWPKEVRRMVEGARSAGLEPAVAGAVGAGWVVAVEGAHVRATAEFVYRAGKTRRVPGRLTIDGDPRPLADSWGQLREIWDEHEGQASAAPAGLMEIGDPGGAPVPKDVRTAKSVIEQRTGGRMPVLAGVNGHHWVIGFDGPDGDGLRIVFTLYGRDWELDEHRPVQVIVGGEDKSAAAEGDMSKAMALAFGAAGPMTAPVAGGGGLRPQPGARDQGVETRRMVVKRELLPPCLIAVCQVHGGATTGDRELSQNGRRSPTSTVRSGYLYDDALFPDRPSSRYSTGGPGRFRPPATGRNRGQLAGQ